MSFYDVREHHTPQYCEEQQREKLTFLSELYLHTCTCTYLTIWYMYIGPFKWPHLYFSLLLSGHIKEKEKERE